MYKKKKVIPTHNMTLNCIKVYEPDLARRAHMDLSSLLSAKCSEINEAECFPKSLVLWGRKYVFERREEVIIVSLT